MDRRSFLKVLSIAPVAVPAAVTAAHVSAVPAHAAVAKGETASISVGYYRTASGCQIVEGPFVVRPCLTTPSTKASNGED